MEGKSRLTSSYPWWRGPPLTPLSVFGCRFRESVIRGLLQLVCFFLLLVIRLLLLLLLVLLLTAGDLLLRRLIVLSLSLSAFHFVESSRLNESSTLDLWVFSTFTSLRKNTLNWNCIQNTTMKLPVQGLYRWCVCVDQREMLLTHCFPYIGWTNTIDKDLGGS